MIDDALRLLRETMDAIDALATCSHAMVVDEAHDHTGQLVPLGWGLEQRGPGAAVIRVTRRCLLCGLAYERRATVLAELREQCRNAWGLRGVRSPWSTAERSAEEADL